MRWNMGYILWAADSKWDAHPSIFRGISDEFSSAEFQRHWNARKRHYTIVTSVKRTLIKHLYILKVMVCVTHSSSHLPSIKHLHKSYGLRSTMLFMGKLTKCPDQSALRTIAPRLGSSSASQGIGIPQASWGAAASGPRESSGNLLGNHPLLWPN